MWKDLTMSQRADMMDLYLSKGITSLDDMRSLYDSSISDTVQGTSFSDGGSIHIKPENRGKFTALKERTGHSATWFKEHGTPAQRKMATFALNARHWKHGYGGHIYDGTTEDSQQMNIPYAGELPDVTVMPRRIANKSWDKVQERWVGDMPTYYAVNPETGKEEMLREIGNGKYSTYDDKHVFDVLSAEAAKKEREQWIKNGGTAGDFDKVMLGTLGLGLAPIALPEIAAGALTPTGQTLLAGTLGGEAWEALNHGITGQSWGDNLGDVIGLDKNNYLGRTALGLTNPFYALSPNMVYKGGEAVLEGLVKPMWNAGKEAVYNIADRYMFMPHQNSFTRGIGGEAGLQDLVESGLVRGNPIGTEVTAKAYGKLTRSNRNNFNDIMRDTGIDNIAHRYYNRSLTEEDFNAIKKAAQKYKESTPSSSAKGRISLLRPDKDPLSKYSSYQDYQTQLASDRQTLANATSLDDSGQPLAYFYDNGRNPLTAGHDYAASDYGVRINNASEYNPRIFDGHLHYSMPEAVPLRDPNVEVFKKGPFGLTYKLDKKTMKPVWQQDLKTLFSKGTNKAPQITAENAASVTPEQWTAAQDAAIARGDMAEAQRLRDLHFKASAPNNKYHNHAYHNTNAQFNEFKPEFIGKTDSGYYGEGFYFTPNKIDANNALGSIQKDVYIYLKNPREITSSDYISGPLINNDGAIVRNGEEGWITLDGTHPPDPNDVMEVVSNIPSRIKSADAVTYGDNGIRIPLGERDNFNISDIRYGLIPFGIGLTGYGLYNSGKEK